MKKIISAFALAAVATGLASADVKITMNGRLRPTFFYNDLTHTGATNGSGEKESNTRSWMNLEGYADFTDTLKFAFTNSDKTAGLTFSVNVTNGNTSGSDSTGLYYYSDGTVSTEKKKEVNGTDENGTEIKTSRSNNKLGNFLTLNQFDIFANVFGTPLKIGAGSWKDGFADGSYRVKKDVDAGNAEGVDFERFKLGSAFKGAPSLFIDDIANFAGGSNALSLYAEYPLALDDGMKLTFTAVAVKADYDVVESAGVTTTYASGYTGRIQFSMEDTLNAEFILKQPISNEHVFGLYLKPLMVEGLDATVGGSYTYATGGNEKWNGAMDFDLRARYQVSPELSITTFNKISMLDAGDGVVGKNQENTAGATVNSGIVGHDGKLGQLIKGKDITNVMWNNISARYKVDDMITATLNIGLINVLSNESDADYGINFRITPGAQLYVASGATFWIGATYSRASYNSGAAGKDDDVYSSWSIPAIFRVKM